MPTSTFAYRAPGLCAGGCSEQPYHSCEDSEDGEGGVYES